MDELKLGPGIVAAAALLILGGAGIAAIPAKGAVRSRQLLLFGIAFGLRFGLSLAFYRFGLIRLVGDNDGLGWVIAREIAEGWRELGFGPLEIPFALRWAYEGSNWGYYFLLASWFRLVGVDGRLPAAALNGFFGAATVVLVYRLGIRVASERAARWAAWLTCCWPSLVLWSAMTIKESVVILLETAFVYAWVRYREERRPALLLAAGVPLAMLPAFRSYSPLVFIGAFLLAWALDQVKAAGERRWPAVVVPAVTLAAVGTFAGPQLAGRLGFDPHTVQQVRETAARESGSALPVTGDLRRPGGALPALAVGSLHFYLGPAPSQFLTGSRRMLLSLPECLCWWVLIGGCLLLGSRFLTAAEVRRLLPLIVVIITYGALLAVTHSNSGQIVRQRSQLVPYLLLIGAASFEASRVKRQRAAAGQECRKTT